LRTGTVLLLFLAPLQAGFFVGEGATGASFLKIPVSARAAALGGVLNGIAGDISTIDTNPAGLVNFTRTDIIATYIDYLEDTSLQSVAAGFPLSSRGSSRASEDDHGGSLFRKKQLGMGVEYRVFHAEDDTRDALGVKAGDLDIRDQLLSVGFAMTPSPVLSVGVTGKYISQKLADESLTNFAGDAGFEYKLNPNFTLAGAIQNLGPSKAFISEKDPLPTTAHFGVVTQNRKWLMLVNGSYGRDKIARESGGVEFTLNHFLKFRGGLFHDTTLEFTGGFGIQLTGPQKNPVAYKPRWRSSDENKKTLENLDNSSKESDSIQRFSNVNFGLDYALSTRKDIGITHTVSLRILY
jgi:hypothetical protein